MGISLPNVSEKSVGPGSFPGANDLLLAPEKRPAECWSKNETLKRDKFYSEGVARVRPSVR